MIYKKSHVLCLRTPDLAEKLGIANIVTIFLISNNKLKKLCIKHLKQRRKFYTIMPKFRPQ